MTKKKFTNKKCPEIVYEILGEEWLDKDTYVIVFAEMTDVDGDIYHLEVEYHKDEERVTYTRVYDYENVEASKFVSPCFKKQIEEYILQQVGVLDKDSFLNIQSIEVELTLGVPKDMTIGEFQEWLKESSIEVNRLVPTAKEKLFNKVKIISINNKGKK